MNSTSRVVNSSRNIIVSVTCQIVTLAFSFITRTFFIHLLGSEYLGLNGLFSSVLSVLSMADLGFSSAITFALYKPIAENDIDKINSLIYYFKRVYRVISVVVAIIGLLCIPFLKYIVNSNIDVNTVLYVYVLQLTNTVFSYLCIYKSTLLMADQRVYITKIVNTIFLIIANLIEIAVLFLFHSYVAYLIVQLSCTILSNITIMVIANRLYPFLRKQAMPISREEKHNIINGVKALFIYRVAGIILNATDNILISTLISTAVVGLYSNYTLVSGSISGIITLALDAVVASIGSLTVQKDIHYAKKNFETLQLICFWLHALISICLFLLLDDFICVWIGQQYILGKWVCLMIVLSIYIPGMMKVIASFRDTTGLYVKTKYVFVFASIINLFLSIFLGKTMGLIGILLATSISRLVTSVPYEPYVLYKFYFNESVTSYFFEQIKYLIILFITGIVCYFATAYIVVNSLFSFILKGCIVFILTNIFFYIAFHNNPAFLDVVSKIKFLLPFNKKS